MAVTDLDIYCGHRLRTLRSQRKLSLAQLSELIDVTPQQVSRFELGTNRLSASQLYRLARGLNCHLGWFYSGYEERSDELKRIETVLRASRQGWQALNPEDEMSELVKGMSHLPSNKRDALRSLVESIVYDL